MFNNLFTPHRETEMQHILTTLDEIKRRQVRLETRICSLADALDADIGQNNGRDYGRAFGESPANALTIRKGGVA